MIPQDWHLLMIVIFTLLKLDSGISGGEGAYAETESEEGEVINRLNYLRLEKFVGETKGSDFSTEQLEQASAFHNTLLSKLADFQLENQAIIIAGCITV